MIQRINGISVPSDLSKDELLELLKSDSMSDFVLACEALTQYKTEDVCDRMAQYLFGEDKYRKLAVLKVIFQNPYALMYTSELEKAIVSDDVLFADNGLLIVVKRSIPVSENIIIAAVEKHILKLRDSLYALECLSVCDKNYYIIIGLLSKCASSIQKEIVANILYKQYLPKKGKELFELFSNSDNPKIRKLAVDIGKKYNYDISCFASDPDGHIRKSVM